MTPLAATTSAATTTGSRPTRNSEPDGSFGDLFASRSATDSPTTRTTERTQAQKTDAAPRQDSADQPGIDDPTAAASDTPTSGGAPTDDEAALSQDMDAQPILTPRDPQAAALELNTQLLATNALSETAQLDTQLAVHASGGVSSDAPIVAATTNALPVAAVAAAGETTTAAANDTDTAAGVTATLPAATPAATPAAPANDQAAASPAAVTEITTVAQPPTGDVPPATTADTSATATASAEGAATLDNTETPSPQSSATTATTAGQNSNPADQGAAQNPGQSATTDRPADTAPDPLLNVVPDETLTSTNAPSVEATAPTQPASATSTPASTMSPAAAVAGAPTLAPARPPLADTAAAGTQAASSFVDAGIGLDDPTAAAVITRAVPERDGNTKLVMRLDPPDLGNLAITMRRDSAGLHVQVTADAALTPAQVQQLRESATQAAQAADTPLADFTASQGNAGDRDNDNQDRGRTIRLAPADQPSDERPPTPRLTGTGTVLWL